jgi:hypothetical protein
MFSEETTRLLFGTPDGYSSSRREKEANNTNLVALRGIQRLDQVLFCAAEGAGPVGATERAVPIDFLVHVAMVVDEN